MREGRSRLNTALTAVVLVLIGFTAGYLARVPIERLVVGLKTSASDAARQRHLAARFLGKPAAGIEASQLDGTRFSLADRKGKVTLVFFWASWCAYSRNAIPGIQAVYDRYAGREDFQVIGVSLDKDREAVEAFVRSRDIRWVNLFEDGRQWNGPAVKAYEVRAIPSRWIVGRDLAISGADLSQAATEDLLSLLLENKRRAGPSTEGAPLAAGLEDAGGCPAPSAQ